LTSINCPQKIRQRQLGARAPHWRAELSRLGYSFNVVSLLAIVLAIGIVVSASVDDAIVVVENVGRVMRH